MKKSRSDIRWMLVSQAVVLVACFLISSVFALIEGGLLGAAHRRLFILCFFLFGAPVFVSPFIEFLGDDPKQNSWPYALAFYYGGAALGWIFGELSHERDWTYVLIGWAISGFVCALVYTARKAHS